MHRCCCALAVYLDRNFFSPPRAGRRRNRGSAAINRRRRATISRLLIQLRIYCCLGKISRDKARDFIESLATAAAAAVMVSREISRVFGVSWRVYHRDFLLSAEVYTTERRATPWSEFIYKRDEARTLESGWKFRANCRYASTCSRTCSVVTCDFWVYFASFSKGFKFYHLIMRVEWFPY